MTQHITHGTLHGKQKNIAVIQSSVCEKRCIGVYTANTYNRHLSQCCHMPDLLNAWFLFHGFDNIFRGHEKRCRSQIQLRIENTGSGIWQVIINAASQRYDIDRKFTDICQVVQNPAGSISISHVNVTGFVQTLMNVHGSSLCNTFINILLINRRRNNKCILQTKLCDQLPLYDHPLGIPFSYGKLNNTSLAGFVEQPVYTQSRNAQVFTDLLLCISFYIIVPGDLGQKFVFI